LTFPLGIFATGSGGSGGDSSRLIIVCAGFGSSPEEDAVERSVIFTGLDSSSESLEDLESEEESSEAFNFLGPSDNVALVSELTINFFAFCVEESLSESEDESEEESEEESGSGIF
jgi:hypothetical protein